MQVITKARSFFLSGSAVLITSLPAAAQLQHWIRQIGSSADDDAYAAAADGTGGVFFAGPTLGSLGGPNAGGFDAWLVHYDSAGNQLWLRQFGSSADDSAHAAAPDGSGGVYLSGETFGSLGGPNAGGSDAWLARYNSAGNLVWIRQFGSPADDHLLAAAPDGFGGVYVSGMTSGNLGGSNAGGTDAWLARYDSAGNQLWIRQLGSSADDDAYGLAQDSWSNVFVTGSTDGNLGGPSSGGGDVWLAHYDNAGTQHWIRQFGTSTLDHALAAAPDGADGVFLGGLTSGDLGGPNAGGHDAWVARYVLTPSMLCLPGSDGVILCPCSNPPAALGLGCDNSSATGGAMIHVYGTASLSADTLIFSADGEKPTALSLLLQGTAVLPSGAVYGQGVRCVAGILKRLFSRAASSGGVTLPDFAAGDTTISARSAALGNPILAGQSRWYLIYYRDPTVLGGCPATSTFNSGATMRALWLP